MFALLISDEAWLNGTNALLGIVCAVAMVAIGGALFHDILLKVREKAASRRFAFDSHTMHVPELGLTMADGGEPVDEHGEPKK
jgi:hypothetical protein